MLDEPSAIIIVELPTHDIGTAHFDCILIPCKVTVAPSLIVIVFPVAVPLFDCVIVAVVLAGTVTFPFARLYVVAAEHMVAERDARVESMTFFMVCVPFQ